MFFILPKLSTVPMCPCNFKMLAFFFFSFHFYCQYCQGSSLGFASLWVLKQTHRFTKVDYLCCLDTNGHLSFPAIWVFESQHKAWGWPWQPGDPAGGPRGVIHTIRDLDQSTCPHILHLQWGIPATSQWNGLYKACPSGTCHPNREEINSLLDLDPDVRAHPWEGLPICDLRTVFTGIAIPWS